MPPRPLSTSPRPTLPVKSLRRKVSSHSSRVPVLTFSVVSPVLVCSPSTIKSSSSCSAKLSRVDPARFLSRYQNSGATTGWDFHIPKVQVGSDVRCCGGGVVDKTVQQGAFLMLLYSRQIGQMFSTLYSFHSAVAHPAWFYLRAGLPYYIRR